MQPPTTSARHLVAYVEASSHDHPGHLVIGHEPPIDATPFVGYRFSPMDLPREFRYPSRHRDYLFDHTVPGYIVDESTYVGEVLSSPSRTYWMKRTPTDGSIATILPPDSEWSPFALYSFNPDDKPDPGKRCYNCVTWGVETANRLVPAFLLPVRQGRVKLIIQQMEAREAGAGK